MRCSQILRCEAGVHQFVAEHDSGQRAVRQQRLGCRHQPCELEDVVVAESETRFVDLPLICDITADGAEYTVVPV